MCYSTKKKIADCVRQLMKRKEISKITIGDIMEATGMSRQSFYYHFKDIYDVLEWIGCNDFKDQLQGQYDSMEKWACDLMEVLQRERSFYEKLANELAWPMIVRGVRMALDAQVRRLLLGENPGMFCILQKNVIGGTGKAGCAVYDAGDCKNGRRACRIAPAHRSIVMLF